MEHLESFLYVRARAVMKDEKEARQLVKDVFACGEKEEVAYNLIYEKGSRRFVNPSTREAKELELWEEDVQPAGEVSEELLEELADVLELLPDLFFATVFACCYDGYSVKQAAAAMGCTEGAVRYRLNYTKKCISDLLEEMPFSLELVVRVIDVWMLRYIDVAQGNGVGQWECLVVPKPKKKEEEVGEEKKKSPAGKIIVIMLLCLAVGTGAYVAIQHFDILSLLQQVKTEREVEVEVEEEPEAEEPIEEEPIAGNPMAEEPAAEEPEVEEPVVEEPVAEEPAAEESEFFFEDSDKRLLKKSELKELTKKELRLARNEIYARYGVVFEVEDLDNYFSSKSWYEPKMTISEFYDVTELNDIEEQNVALIKEVENDK